MFVIVIKVVIVFVFVSVFVFVIVFVFVFVIVFVIVFVFVIVTDLDSTPTQQSIQQSTHTQSTINQTSVFDPRSHANGNSHEEGSGEDVAYGSQCQGRPGRFRTENPRQSTTWLVPGRSRCGQSRVVDWCAAGGCAVWLVGCYRAGVDGIAGEQERRIRLAQSNSHDPGYVT